MGDEHRKGGLFKGKLPLKALRPFDHPGGEHLPRVHSVILISQLHTDRLRLPCGITGHNPIHQGGAKEVFLPEPLYKGLPQLPLPGIGHHTPLQLLSVIVDKLAGQDHKALSFFPAEGPESLIQKLCQLSRKAVCRLILKAAGRIIHNPGFRGITDNKPQMGISGAFHVCLIIPLRIQAAADTGDHPPPVCPYPFFISPKKQSVKPLLLIQGLPHSAAASASGLNHCHLRVKARLFIHLVYKIIHKGPQKNSFPELKHPLRPFPVQIALIAQFLQRLIR